MTRRRLSRLLPILLAVAPLACDTEGGDGGGGTTGTIEDPCANDDRGDDYAVGLSRTGDAGQITLTFVDAMPAPPRKGDNRWILKATWAADGAPIDDATFTVTPFMPDHGHGTPVPVGVEHLPNPRGTWAFDPLNLMMAGLWEITFDIEAPSPSGDGTNVSDSVVFRFCVDP